MVLSVVGPLDRESCLYLFVDVSLIRLSLLLSMCSLSVYLSFMVVCVMNDLLCPCGLYLPTS